MTLMPGPQPGWYDDPDGVRRWWDGAQWGPGSAISPATPAGSAALPPASATPAYHPQPMPRSLPAYPVLVANVSLKDVGITYLFAILLGGFGAHRFYLGRIGSAITLLLLWQIGVWTLAFGIGLLLVVAAGIWFIVDLCTIPGMVRETNHRRMAEHQQQFGMRQPPMPPHPPMPPRSGLR